MWRVAVAMRVTASLVVFALLASLPRSVSFALARERIDVERPEVGADVASRTSDAGPDAQRDRVCGPRCVRFLLSFYQKKEAPALIEIVREVQWPNLAGGAALSDLSQVLKRQGVHTCMMKLSPQARLCWKYPVLIHLRPDDDGDMGHFVVWLPESTASHAYVWSGASGVLRLPTNQLARRMTGPVLLTAGVPIADPQAAVARRTDSALWFGAWAVTLGFLAAAIVYCWRGRAPRVWFAQHRAAGAEDYQITVNEH